MGALAGKGVVVTGAGRGIGRALAIRATQEGARVVVNDLDADNARAVAEEVGGTAVPGDASSADGVTALVDAATEALGRVDVYFANAGIDGAYGFDSLQSPDDLWERVVDVNVMAHVRAARTLVPRWLADGQGGRFVVTASAAGLLTMIGSAPYSVTKHAAVGFAEWLSVTYGARGVDVHAIWPPARCRTCSPATAPWSRRRSRRRRSPRSRRAGSWCSPIPRSAPTTSPAPPTPTAGWPGCSGCRPSSTRVG